MRAKNPFKSWQLTQQLNREMLLSDFLSTLSKSRVRVEYVTDLAEMAARHISESERRPCNRSTLLRNIRYKALLVSFMARSATRGSDQINSKRIIDPNANALLLAAELRAKNLTQEVARLKAYISGIDSLSVNTSTETSIKGESDQKQETYVAHLPFIRTCQALLAVLKHFDKLLCADVDTKRIVDMACRPPLTVVDGETAAPFFAWMYLNRDVGGRQKVL